MKISIKCFLIVSAVMLIYPSFAQHPALDRLYTEGYSLMEKRGITETAVQKKMGITMSKGLSYAIVFKTSEGDLPKVFLMKSGQNSNLTKDQSIVATNFHAIEVTDIIKHECQMTGIYEVAFDTFQGEMYVLWNYGKEQPHALSTLQAKAGTE